MPSRQWMRYTGKSRYSAATSAGARACHPAKASARRHFLHAGETSLNQPAHIQKKACRAAARAARAVLTPEQAALWSARVRARLEELPEYRQATALLTYAARGNEVDTLPLLESNRMQDRPVFVPYLNDGAMGWARVTSEEQLQPGAHGILEPPPDLRRPVRIPADAAVLIPCLQFTASGHRLGYGGGYFDRFLAGFAGPKIALAYALQRNDALPVEAHDVPVDIVITESESVRVLASRG